MSTISREVMVFESGFFLKLSNPASMILSRCSGVRNPFRLRATIFLRINGSLEFA